MRLRPRMQDLDHDGMVGRRLSPPGKPHLPWGIYVISAACGLVAILAVSSFLKGNATERWFGGFCAVASLLLGVGIVLRINLFRVSLLFLLYASVLAEFVLVLSSWQAGAGIGYGIIFVRLGLTVWAIIYLQRSDVSLAFAKQDLRPGGDHSQQDATFTPRENRSASTVANCLRGVMSGFACFILLLICINAGRWRVTTDWIHSLFFGLVVCGGIIGFLVSGTESGCRRDVNDHDLACGDQSHSVEE